MCGGTAVRLFLAGNIKGLSPRVRGNPTPWGCWQTGRRSIPACAGEPSTSRPGSPSPGVYPRVCGGTSFAAMITGANSGLSPRVRGNRAAQHRGYDGYGSIPACAGEPAATSRWPSVTGVYPRVCGGTYGTRGRSPEAEGLSPRVRGNHLESIDADLAERSIPACAGEPGFLLPVVT